MSTHAIEVESAPGASPKAGVKAKMLTLDALDGRTAAAKLVRSVIDAIAVDLGGIDTLSEGKRQLVQRAAVLGALIEEHEARWLVGEPFDAAEYPAAINAQRRVLTSLGLERRARDVPSPH